MTNGVSTNNSTSFVPSTGVSDQPVVPTTDNSTGAAFTATGEKVDEFTSTIAVTDVAIADTESAINATDDETKKQGLKDKKQKLITQKQELEGKQKALKEKMPQLKAELDAQKTDVSNKKQYLDTLYANKSSLEKTMQSESKELANKNVNLTDINSKITDTKAALDDKIAELNDAVSEMIKKSDDELKKQRSAISEATSEALALVQSGEITSEEMPSYIAGKLNDLGSADGTKMCVVDADNTQIKALCGELAGYVTQQGTIQLSIKASNNKIENGSPILTQLNEEIKNKSSELATSEGLMNAKQSEFDTANTEYANNDAQIADIDSQLTTIDTEIATVDAPVAPVGAPVAPVVPTGEAQGTVQYGQFFPTSTTENAGLGLNFDDAMLKINDQYNQTLKEEVKNTELETIKSKMIESDKLITTLRSHLSDNAQKMIEERLAATKRK